LLKAANRMFANKKFIHAHEFEAARVLTHFSSEIPCNRIQLFDLLFADTNLDFKGKLRKLHTIIENLRKVWLLPVGSRKNEPSGYWLITEFADFKDWVERAKSAPITQLSTIHKNARFNFPEFAEQLEFEFWNDMEPK
jgi:benzoyl-CoA reductase/2-hydroxyglutaryl-CoA dehydratase subunit BcrC/BadD/HgdB